MLQPKLILTTVKELYATRVRAGYLMAFVLLLISYSLTFIATQSLIKQAAMVDHTNRVLSSMEYLMSNLKDAETGFRGYVIMKDEQFLEPYYSSSIRVNNNYNELCTLTIDRADYHKKLDTLHLLINRKIDLVRSGILMYNKSDFILTDTVKSFIKTGKATMDSIRRIIKEMQLSESSLLKERAAQFKRSSASIRIINITSLVLSLVLALYSLITFNKENRDKKESDQKALQYRDRLEKNNEELYVANRQLMEFKSIEKFAATGRIARIIAHEVRNPLTNIGLAAEQLKSEIVETEETAILLEMIKRNGIRINQLITDLLQSTKFAQLDYKVLSIKTLVDESIDLAKDRIDLNNIQLITSSSEDVCLIRVDAEKIRIALLNIIINAIEAMEPGSGILTITTETREKCIVTITDNGKGMDAEMVSKLFEPYFSGKHKGTGLGLTHTQNIILNHKGNIYVKSELGKGTAISIELELHKE